MDVGDWLRSLGLGQHDALFRENEIDAEVLPELTEADLEKIGVPLGHRKRLLKAIANLGAAESPAKPTIPPPAASSRDVGERRPITVMFCDLVGSTSLAAKFDPEDWRSLVAGYLDEASKAVTSLGGHVLKKLGDGLMALFGYPKAQENDGERAVRAALAIQRALVDLNARNAATGAPELAARIGLESGRVVVDPSGEVYGEAPNVAARVQSAAAPGEIWITRDVHRQIAGLFVAEDKGAHELKGVAEKTQLYRIVRARGETLYEACQDCHSLDKNDVGPRHRGVFGRKATSLPDYDYSDALKSTKIVWNEETLDKWLTDPQAVAPGDKMFFHLDNPQDRADVIAYLKERAK